MPRSNGSGSYGGLEVAIAIAAAAAAQRAGIDLLCNVKQINNNYEYFLNSTCQESNN
jgi:hypothetical protein